MTMFSKDIKEKDNTTASSWGQPDIAVEEPGKENNDKETPIRKGNSQDLSFNKTNSSQADLTIKPAPNNFNVQLQPDIVTPKMSPSVADTGFLIKEDEDNKKEKEEERKEDESTSRKLSDFTPPPNDNNEEKNKPEEKKKEKESPEKGENAEEIKTEPKGQKENKESEKEHVPSNESLQNPQAALIQEPEKPKEKEALPTIKDPFEQVKPELKSTGKEESNLSQETSKSAAPAPKLDATDSQSFLHSLAASSPTAFVQGVKQSGTLVPEIQQNEKSALTKNMPVIEQPTGIPVKGEQTGQKEIAELSKGELPDLQTKGKKEGKQIELKHAQTLEKANVANVPTPKAHGDTDPSFVNNVKQAINNLSTHDGEVNTSAGERPKVDMSGEAEIAQNEKNQALSTEEVAAEQGKADAAAAQDFGEKDICPEIKKEMMRPNVKLSAIPPTPATESLEDLPATTGDIYTAFDAQAKVKMDEQVQVEMEKNELERQKMEETSSKEREDGQRKIDEETQKVKIEQVSAQTTARSEVEGHRKDWKTENEKVKQEYADKSEAKKKEIDQNIDTEVQQTDAKVNTELTNAEAEAEKENRKTQEEAEKKKREAENKEPSFWDSVKRAISDFFDELKEGLNMLFDGLRKLVKGIIELAKKAVNGLIELARRAIVGFIKAFGEALKVFVNVALAAFPGIAKRINGLIDKAIDVAVKVVNTLAEGLKKIASAILDAIGAALDFILSAYQAAYNLLLDVLKFISVGIIKILRGLANMAEAIYNSPDHFLGQATDEFIGTDVTQPLPMGQERTQEEYDNMVARMNVGSPTTEGVENKVASAEEQQNNLLLSKTTITEEDVSLPVLNNPDLSPAIMSYISGLPEGEYDLYEQDGEGTGLAAMQNELLGSGVAAPELSKVENQGVLSNLGTLDRFEVGPDKKVGPFTIWERTKLVFERIGSAIKKMANEWWEANKVYIIAGAVVVALGLIAAIILTGGAILGAIPPLLEGIMLILTIWSLSEAIPKIKDHIADFAKKSYNGVIVPGSKHFARAFAIAAMEIIGLIPGAKGGLKGAKSIINILKKEGVAGLKAAAKTSVKAFIKTQAEWGRKVFQTAVSGAKKAINKGKYLLTGLSKGVASGFRKVDDLINYIKKAYSYLKKIRIRIRGTHWQIGIMVNPFFVLMEGDLKGAIQYIKKEDLKKGLDVGGDFIKEGKQAKLISMAEKLPEDAYRAFWQMFNNKSAVGSWIHHIIEKNSRWAKFFSREFIHSPVRLVDIPSGIVNRYLHLSRIRTSWDKVYSLLDRLSGAGKISDKSAKLLMLDFAAHTEKYISDVVSEAKKLGITLTESDMIKLCDDWLVNNKTDDFIKAVEIKYIAK